MYLDSTQNCPKTVCESSRWFTTKCSSLSNQRLHQLDWDVKLMWWADGWVIVVTACSRHYSHCTVMVVCVCLLGKGRRVILPSSGALYIRQVTASDTGRYRCVAVNPVSRVRRTSPVDVRLRLTSPRHGQQLMSLTVDYIKLWFITSLVSDQKCGFLWCRRTPPVRRLANRSVSGRVDCCRLHIHYKTVRLMTI